MSATDDVEVDVDEIENESTGFEQAPCALFMHDPADPDAPRVSHAALACYMVLRHFGAEKNFHISRAKIAKAMGRDPRSITAYVRELEDAGWLQITETYRQTGDRGRKSNQYKVLWRRIRDDNDPRVAAHAEKVAALEMQRIADRDARRSGGTPPLFPR